MQQTKKSTAGYIREQLDEIERKIYTGIRHEAIVAELTSEGYPMSIRAFRNYLFRARQKAKVWRERNSCQEPVAPPPAPLPLPENSAKKEESESMPEPVIGLGIDAILKTPVDLDAYARFAKRKNK